MILNIIQNMANIALLIIVGLTLISTVILIIVFIIASKMIVKNSIVEIRKWITKR